ncbi:TniQ family protein [Microbulbifer sp. JMSA003]|uniref:TniQ family protein n=1 Tax=Microbulbifer sp. JMSA003 TaxID=3243369 RepID=UPI0040398F6F
MKTRLPIPCKLQPGESLPGLFSRAVISNHYGGLSSLSKWFGVSASSAGIDINYMRYLAMGKLDIDQLAIFTEHTSYQIKQAALQLGSPCPGGRYDEYISIRRWRYCPLCIKQGISHQKAWLLPFVTACPNHKCEIVDSCHRCGHCHSVSLPLLPYCGNCQAFAKIVLAHPHELECSHVLIENIDSKRKLKTILDRLMTAWYLSTSEALRPHYRFSPQLRTIDEMRTHVIQLWPAANEPTHLASAIETQKEYLSDRWPHLPLISNMLVSRALTAGATLPNKELTKKKINLLRDNDPWWVPQSVAATAAGISDHIIQQIIDKKIIKSRLFSDVGVNSKRHKFRMVDLHSWHTLIEELYSKAIRVEDQKGLSSILMFPLHEVIRGVCTGKMSIFSTESNALSDLMVKFNETKTSVRRKRKPSDTMTSAEAAKILGTYHAVIADFVARGILKIHPNSNKRRLLIRKVSVIDFHKQYILVGTIAKKYDINCTNLAEKLASLGITPAPFNALVTIYQRTDIEHIDIKAVKNLESYTTLAGRKSTVDTKRIDNPAVKKLIELVENHGGSSSFCRKFGYSPGTLSLIMRGKKSFGVLAAQRMEKRCGLEKGHFNQSIDYLSS